MKSSNPMRRSWLEDSGGWIPHRLPMIVSPAWRLRPVPLCNVLERLEIEHMRHAGQENGHLIVSYDQFVKHGVSRKIILPALQLGEALGLLAVERSDKWQRNIRAPNEYRLTYLPEKGRRAPTDEWSGLSEEQVEALVADFQKAARTRRKSEPQFPFQPPSSSPFAQKGHSSSSPYVQTLVSQGEQSLTSGRNSGNGVRHAKEAPPSVGRERRSVQAGQP